jgi:hypothetical protein
VGAERLALGRLGTEVFQAQPLLGRRRRNGVVRLAERLDDTVGLSAFRSKYADVVVCSGCVSGSGDLPPGGEAVGHHLSVLVRGQQVSAWPEVRGYRAEHGEEPLRVGV